MIFYLFMSFMLSCLVMGVINEICNPDPDEEEDSE